MDKAIGNFEAQTRVIKGLADLGLLENANFSRLQSQSKREVWQGYSGLTNLSNASLGGLHRKAVELGAGRSHTIFRKRLVGIPTHTCFDYCSDYENNKFLRFFREYQGVVNFGALARLPDDVAQLLANTFLLIGHFLHPITMPTEVEHLFFWEHLQEEAFYADDPAFGAKVEWATNRPRRAFENRYSTEMYSGPYGVWRDTLEGYLEKAEGRSDRRRYGVRNALMYVQHALNVADSLLPQDAKPLSSLCEFPEFGEHINDYFEDAVVAYFDLPTKFLARQLAEHVEMYMKERWSIDLFFNINTTETVFRAVHGIQRLGAGLGLIMLAHKLFSRRIVDFSNY